MNVNEVRDAICSVAFYISCMLVLLSKNIMRILKIKCKIKSLV